MMEAGGVVLTTSRDAFEVYPTLWKNKDAAGKAFQRAKIASYAVPDGLRRVDYLRVGRGQQPAVAWLAATCDPDEVRAFLVEPLGPLARWDVAPMPGAASPEPPASPSPGAAPAPSAQLDAVPILRPEISAYVAPDGHGVLAQCPFCDMLHRHGGFGPRHAHCADPSGRIYILCDAGPAPASILDPPMTRNNAPSAK